MFEWKNIFRGMLIGTSDLIPGVSGGTIAVILGIYDRLIEAISGFFTKEWKKHLGFLIPLGIGVGIVFMLLSRVIDWLLTNYPQPTHFFFLGLIIGIIPYLLKEIDFKTNFTAKHYSILIVSAILIGATAFLKPDTQLNIESLTLLTAIGLFFSGWLGSMAMLLPGISGSFILLLIGVYGTAINALKTFNLPILIVIGAGVAVGFIISSKVIRFLLSKFRVVTYAVIIGLVLGSIVVIYPGITADMFLLVLSVLALALGLFTAVTLGKKEH
ncbi:DUF368 domain-containing protein [Bacillus aquiflavi]|uniref:DUF368 domain-containing protein n=1 Tax=Bacillus aquiflavi TaxID=2672567 RepID=A0A6B3W4N3_9BACI|nr:DUF368 domain-containing protein [Bacillus aquiflavi]MBA4538533.1 DUF368 domain-containing protein [Bacillus aquiflavi]NEY82896.1 DUF368 domain-containing protein [Bacillus aquiflavi]